MTWLQELSELRGKIKKLLNAGFVVDPSEYMPKTSGSKSRGGEELFSAKRGNETSPAGSRRSVEEDRSSLN